MELVTNSESEFSIGFGIALLLLGIGVAGIVSDHDRRAAEEIAVTATAFATKAGTPEPTEMGIIFEQ